MKLNKYSWHYRWYLAFYKPLWADREPENIVWYSIQIIFMLLSAPMLIPLELFVNWFGKKTKIEWNDEKEIEEKRKAAQAFEVRPD